MRDPAPTTVPMASPPAYLSARRAGAPAGRQKKTLKLALPGGGALLSWAAAEKEETNAGGRSSISLREALKRTKSGS